VRRAQEAAEQAQDARAAADVENEERKLSVEAREAEVRASELQVRDQAEKLLRERRQHAKDLEWAEKILEQRAKGLLVLGQGRSVRVRCEGGGGV
jgi:hypothetical protein